METNQERILAYALAKELNPKDLGEVSGGGVTWTNNRTVTPTGDVRSPDAQIDASLDW